MKAAWRERYGTGEVLKIRDVAIPEPEAEEILLRVHSTTVNRTDCANLTARPWIMRLFQGFIRPRNPVPGTDFAGEVVNCGSSVRRARVGDQLWGFHDAGISSQAEYMIIPAGVPVGRVPENMPLIEAVACLEGAHYAINFLNKNNLQPGQSALVNGGTGAIGSAMIQLLHNRGLEVTATCPGAYAEQVRMLGATGVIDYEKEDFTRCGQTFDYVFDAVGKSTFGRCRRLLKPRGVYMSSELGPFIQNPFLALFTRFSRGKRVRFPLPVDVPGTLAHMKELAEAGKFRPLIDREYKLKEAGQAYDYVLSGRKTGNVILRMHTG